MHYCFKDKGTGDILISGEGNWCATVFKRKILVFYCFKEKGTGALLISGEENWCITVLRRRKQVLYRSQEKGNGALRRTVASVFERGSTRPRVEAPENFTI